MVTVVAEFHIFIQRWIEQRKEQSTPLVCKKILVLKVNFLFSFFFSESIIFHAQYIFCLYWN